MLVQSTAKRASGGVPKYKGKGHRMTCYADTTDKKATNQVPVHSGVPRGGFGVFKPPHPRNSEDIGGVLDRTSKKNRRLDFLLQFTVFLYGCNLLNKGFF